MRAEGHANALRRRAGNRARREPKMWPVLLLAVVSAVAIGLLDYVTGVWVRVYPLYYLPISVAAWRGGLRWALALAVLCTLIWMSANHLAGLPHSGPWVEAFNVAMQMGSFGLIGALIASLRAAYARERERSCTDALTGLMNSRGFYDEASRLLALARRYRRALTIAYIDLDNFKQVNDTLGHAGGDQVLRVAAETLVQGVRRVDLVARLGGDEFALLMPETNGEGAASVLERLHVELVRRLRRRCPVTGASIGAVAFSRPPAQLDALIHRADALMYAVKRSHKNRLQIEIAEDEDEDSGASCSLAHSGEVSDPDNSYASWVRGRL